MKIFFFFFVFSSTLLSAQNGFDHWYFGNGAFLVFSTNGTFPTPSSSAAIHSMEGSASISDDLGNLIFYTDGQTVWRPSHSPMPNGTGLNGNSSTTQSSLILPVPGNANQFYIFTLNSFTENGDLCYSIADMSLDGGMGDILPGSKNILLGSNFTEKLVAASSACGLWVLAHKRQSDAFYAFPVDITGTGIGAPVISNVGTPHVASATDSGSQGVMKVSQDNQRIAVAIFAGTTEILDFNPASGVVSNPISLPAPNGIMPYGLCFSPNGQILYAGEGHSAYLTPNSVYQYNLSSGIQSAILASKTLVGHPYSVDQNLFDLQLGPDGRIYVARGNSNYLDVIYNPNVFGVGCNYVGNSIQFPGTQSACWLGLPNQPRSPQPGQAIQPDLGNDTLICQGLTLTLNAPATGPWLWSDGSTGDSLVVSAPGTYWLKVGAGTCANRDTIVVTVQSVTVNAGNDLTVCAGNPVTLAASGAGNYNWTGGISNGVPFTPVSSQTYTVTGTDAAGCSGSDQVMVTVENAPPVQFSANLLSGCIPLLVSFQASGAPGSTFSWDFGDGQTGTGPNPPHLYNSSGCRDVALQISSANGCTASATLSSYICALLTPTADFTHDPLVLERSGTEIIFENTSENATSWLWNFGDQSSSADHSPTHNYAPTMDGYEVTLTAYNSNGCKDSVKAFIPFNGGPLYYVPNAFTPDGNEFNQTFLPVFTSGFDPTRFSLQIFNRWGELLFESSNYQVGWDGSSVTGTIVPDGVYVWKIYFSPPDNDARKMLTGHVTLTR